MVLNNKIIGSLFFILSPSFLFCQNLDYSQKESRIIPMLCHKWNVELKMDSVVKQIFPSETFSTINFIANGNLTIEIGSDVQGTWKYDAKTDNLSLKVKNDSVQLKILKLTNEKMVFEKKHGNGKLEKGFLWRSD